MLSIRLSRIGKKKQPAYRVIVLDKRKDPWGNYLENLGFYNPRTNPKTIELKEERIKYWLSVGAQPSPTVHNLLIDAKIIKGSKVKATILRKKEKTSETSAKTSKISEEKTVEAPIKTSSEIPEVPIENTTNNEQKPANIENTESANNTEENAKTKQLQPEEQKITEEQNSPTDIIENVETTKKTENKAEISE